MPNAATAMARTTDDTKATGVGAGDDAPDRHRHGQIIEVDNAEAMPFELLAAFDRITYPPRGAAGGTDGAAGGLATFTGRTFEGQGFQKPDGDERLLVRPPVGGWGEPANRPTALAARDRETGLGEG
jgi:N-methylhydantoinase B